MVAAPHIEQAALARAISKAGSKSELARLIGVSATSVWKMVNKAKRASVGYVLAIEAATGVSRHDLRPDIYPRDTGPAGAAAASFGNCDAAGDGAPIGHAASMPASGRNGSCDRGAISQLGGEAQA